MPHISIRMRWTASVMKVFRVASAVAIKQRTLMWIDLITVEASSNRGMRLSRAQLCVAANNKSFMEHGKNCNDRVYLIVKWNLLRFHCCSHVWKCSVKLIALWYRNIPLFAVGVEGVYARVAGYLLKHFIFWRDFGEETWKVDDIALSRIV